MTSSLTDDIYLSTRLRAARRASGLPVSVQFDLARSPLSDDHLEQATHSFGADPHQGGWGLSHVLNDLLSREPNTVPVTDLTQLQSNLVAQGYLPPDFAPNGSWDAATYAAFRRWDRDNFNSQLAGKHWLAAPVSAGLRMIQNTLPSRVFQGVVGAAKGIVTQAPETISRGGLLGGAAEGAAVGAGLGSFFPGPGTAIGAAAGGIIGGLGGFFGSLFGNHENPLEALSPIDEYLGKGGPKALFTDLGWVLSAASMLKGAGIAVEGARAGAAAYGAAEGTGMRALLATAPVEQPGWAGRVTAAALNKVSSREAGFWTDRFAKLAVLQKAQSTPLLKAINGTYTGLSAGQLGARLAGGLGSGKHRTTIEKAITETPELPGVVDWAGLVVNPSRFFPVRLRELGQGAEKLLGDASFWPYVHAMGTGPEEAKRTFKSWFSSDAEAAWWDRRLRLEAGIDAEAGRMTWDVRKSTDAETETTRFADVKAGIIRKIKDEGAEAGTSTTAERLMGNMDRDPALFAAWMVRLHDQGSGIDRLSNFIHAEKAANELTTTLKAGGIEAKIPGGNIMREAPGEGFHALMDANAKLDQAKELARQAESARVTNPSLYTQLTMQSRALEAEAKAAKRSLPEITKREAVKGEPHYTITAAKMDTPTQQDLYALAKDYESRRQRVIGASKALEKGTTPEGMQELHAATESFNEVVADLADRRLIPRRLAEDVKGNLGKGAKGKKVADALRERAKTAARDIVVPEEWRTRFTDLGYKPVSTGTDVLFTEDMSGLVEPSGLGDYTRRRSFFDTIGLNPTPLSNQSLFALRSAAEENEMRQVLSESGINITGREAKQRIYRTLEKAKSGTFIGPLVKGEGTSAKLRIFPVDVRQLGVDDVMRAFEDVPNFTEENALNVIGALKRGASFGGEMRFLDPTDSMRELGRAMRVSGLPGFSDMIRTWRIEGDTRKFALGGAALGAGVGYIYGDNKAEDALKGALYGGLAGAGLGKALKLRKGAYGWLPDKLVGLNSALRYTLSWTFDAGRYMEQNMTAMVESDLPFIGRPERYIRTRSNLKSIGIHAEQGAPISGDAAWDEATSYMNRIRGTSQYSLAEDIDRRMSQAGILGFRPHIFETAQAYLLKQRGMADGEILRHLRRITGYGTERAALDKSANFVFFPFSFSKKLVTLLGDAVLQAPARSLLINEGLRRYHESGFDKDISDFLDHHLPLLKQLYRLNNLAYGLSPGRFFLEGVSDDKTTTGKVAQLLTSFFVPSGAATTLAQAGGKLGDVAINAFTPVVVTGQDLPALADIVGTYIPFIRDLSNYYGYAGEQVRALPSQLGGEGEPSYLQLQDYEDARRMFKAQWEPMAQGLGYSSADNFMQSSSGAIVKAQYDQLNQELSTRYPTGWRMSQDFTNIQQLNDKAILDIAQKPHRSAAEDEILKLAHLADVWGQIGSSMGWDSGQVTAVVGPMVRNEALRHVDDTAFDDLYRQLYEGDFGPIVRAA